MWTHFISDLERPQCADPAAAYFSCTSSGPVVERIVHPDAAVHGPRTFFPYRRYAGARLREAAPAGTRLRFTLRDVSMQTYEEPLFNLRLAIPEDADRLVGYLGDVCYTVTGGTMDDRDCGCNRYERITV